MMRAQLDDVRERGEPIAALWASEETIYGRFGYGLASLRHQVTLPRTWASMRAMPLRAWAPFGSSIRTRRSARFRASTTRCARPLLAFSHGRGTGGSCGGSEMIRIDDRKEPVRSTLPSSSSTGARLRMRCIGSWNERSRLTGRVGSA